MSTNPRLRLIVIGLAFAFLFLVAGSAAGTQRVITIYFHGTGGSIGGPDTALVDLYFQDHSTAIEWADIELVPCLAGENGEGGPEARAQIEVVVGDTEATPGSLHYKYSVEGFGATLEPMVACLAEFANPDTGVRTWNQVTGEALSAIRAVVVANDDGDTYVVNLVGHSRGGVMTLRTARAAVDAPDLAGSIDRINILAYDPVPGIYDPVGYFGNGFILSPSVRNYVGLYCEHDRRFLFEPIIPLAESGDTRVWIERIPGSHTDLVWTKQPHKEVGLGIGEQLLDSPDWGYVPIDPTSPVDNETTFLDAADAMAKNFDYTATMNEGPFPTLLGCHPDAMIRASTPALSRVLRERICYAAPKRHEPHWGFSFECGLVYYNAEEVFFLSDIVGRQLGSGDWAALQYMRGLTDSRVDTVPPVPRVADLPTIDVACPVTVTVAVPLADDVVSGVIEGTTTTPSFSSPGTYEITWSYTDSAGNTSTQTQTVIVQADTSPPALTVLPSLTAITSSEPGACEVFVSAERLGAAVAIDDCAGPVPVTVSGVPAGNRFPIGTTTLIYTATDAHGNTATKEQTVTVVDDTPPSVVAPADVTRSTGAEVTSCGLVIDDATLGNAITTDNCAGVVVTRSGVPVGNFFPVGSTSVTWTATDASGNTSSATQAVTVADDTPPVLIAPPSLTVPTGAGATSCGVVIADVILGTATATDNCPLAGATVRSGVPEGNFFPLGTTTITWMVADTAGNTATTLQTVTVIDDSPPMMAGLVAAPAILWPPNHQMKDVAVDYAAADNCGPPVCALTVVSDELAEGTGDGDIAPDWEVVGPHLVRLRAERSGTGDGRIYTITLSCTDSSGGTSRAFTTVTAPKSQSR